MTVKTANKCLSVLTCLLLLTMFFAPAFAEPFHSACHSGDIDDCGVCEVILTAIAAGVTAVLTCALCVGVLLRLKRAVKRGCRRRFTVTPLLCVKFNE